MMTADLNDAAVRAAAAAAPYPGTPVTIGGVVYIVPAMSVSTARQHWDRIEQAQAGKLTGPDLFDLTLDLLFACLRRNHPEVQIEMVAEHLDVDNHAELNAMCFGRGAWLRWVELNALGNGLLALPEGGQGVTGGSGATSSPPSSPPLAGDSPTSSA